MKSSTGAPWFFSIAYHDFVYDPLRNDNEVASAIVAQDRLTRLGLDEVLITKCMGQILTTADHTPSRDPDTNYFSDADLFILGTDDETYRRYATNIRQEYRQYPDVKYKPGRRNALHHFLQMEHIYKTPHFREKYEQQARENMIKELQFLS